MKKNLLLLLALCLVYSAKLLAQCPSGDSEIIIEIDPDIFPNEISWELRYLGSNDLIGQGTIQGDTFCLPESQCAVFTIFDSFGDGIFLPGFCKVYYNGVLIFNTNGQQYHSLNVAMNCPPGTQCSSAFEVEQGVHVAPNADTWYSFTADSTGNYTISTCDLGNTCDTKLYGYEDCPLVQDEGVLGVVAFNSDYCGEQAQFTIALEEGQSIFIRVGDSEDNDCANTPINWSVYFSGLIVGCMDPEACNFNPLAGIPDTTACEYPPPGQTCEGPDLAPDHDYLVASMSLNNNHIAQTCELEEGCILGYGSRQLLQYGVRIWNFGNQPYYPGTPQTNPNGYEWAPCHGHYHYIGFAESYLYNSNYEQVDFARKTSYAIVNTDCLPGASGGGPALAPGCGDTYPSGYGCQWVDVTDLDTGNYFLILRVNGPELPDFLGRIETNFDNNATQVCVHIGLNAQGNKTMQIINDCDPLVDCAGIPLGTSSLDCAGECNGSRVRADLNLDETLNYEDLERYMTETVLGTIDNVSCNQLTSDDTYTVLDAANLNACLRFNDGEHQHFGGGGGNHSHCNFPFHVTNNTQSITFGLGNVNDNYLDLMVTDGNAYMLGFDLSISGIVIDSVVNIVGNYYPTITFNPNGRIMALALDEFPLNKYFTGGLLRIYFSEVLSNVICIDEIHDVVNSDVERIMHENTGCVYVTSTRALNEEVGLSVVPNPSSNQVEVTIEGGLLGDASVAISSPSGQVLWQDKKVDNLNRFSIDVSGFPTGVYFLTVSNGRFVKTERLVVAR